MSHLQFLVLFIEPSCSIDSYLVIICHINVTIILPVTCIAPLLTEKACQRQAL